MIGVQPNAFTFASILYKGRDKVKWTKLLLTMSCIIKEGVPQGRDGHRPWLQVSSSS